MLLITPFSCSGQFQASLSPRTVNLSFIEKCCRESCPGQESRQEGRVGGQSPGFILEWYFLWDPEFSFTKWGVWNRSFQRYLQRQTIEHYSKKLKIRYLLLFHATPTGIVFNKQRNKNTAFKVDNMNLNNYFFPYTKRFSTISSFSPYYISLDFWIFSRMGKTLIITPISKIIEWVL